MAQLSISFSQGKLNQKAQTYNHKDLEKEIDFLFMNLY